MLLAGVACSAGSTTLAPTSSAPAPSGSAAPASQTSPAPAPSGAASPSAVLAVPSPSVAAAAASNGNLKTINVSFAAIAAVYAPFYVAMDKGYYAAQGLQINAIQAGGGAATPALISGELAFSTSPAAAIPSMFQGAPLKIILVNGDRQSYDLWSSSKDITTLQGRQYFTTYRDQTIAIMQKYSGRSLDQDTIDYDETVPDLTADGTMPNDALVNDEMARAAVVNVSSSQVPPLSQLYDFSFVQQANQQLAASGWTPTP